MKTKCQVIRFKNERLWCRCLNGECPNYNDECGEGGKKINIKYGHDVILKELKKSFRYNDHTFARKHQAEKNRFSREKKNGK